MLKATYQHYLKKVLKQIADKAQAPIRLRAHQNVLTQSNHPDYKWLAANDDPQLSVQKKRHPIKGWRRRFQPGWYLLQIDLKHPQANHHLAKLYIDYGEGIQDENCILLPLRPHRHTTRIIHLHASPDFMRLDPTETDGPFQIKTFKLIPLPTFYALHRQTVRIKMLHLDYQHLTLGQIKKALRKKAKSNQKTLAETILEAYNQTFTNFQVGKDYGQWIQKTEIPLMNKYLQTRVCADTQPTLSILLPTYQTEPQHLKDCIESVIRQTYANWQLCIVDDASPSQKHLAIIENAQQQDARIQYQRRTENGHISQASNDALSMASGKYTLLLDHDDRLSPHALTLFVDAINKHPKAKLFYADEDKIDELGHRYMPHFKPDWNPDLLYSQNYIGHPVVYQTQRFKQINGFRTGVEGSQDHDLLLRYTQNLNNDEIIHLPWILYHWRAIEASTAQNSDSKGYTSQAGIKALQDFFNRQTLNHTKIQNVTVEAGQYPNTYRCRWPLPKQPPLVSLLIPTRDGYDILKTCIDSILQKTTYPHYEILILNNQTTCPKTLALFDSLTKDHSNVRVLNWDHPFNYSAINNFGVKHAQGEIIGLMNNDIEVITPDWLTEMVSHAIRPEIGCVGAKLYYPNDTIQHAGVILGIGGVAVHSHKYVNRDHPGYFSRLTLTQNLTAVTAACLLVRKSIYQKVKGLDDKNLTVAFNDVDFCLKVREAGYRNLWTPWAELYHHESISRGAEDNPHKQKRAQLEIKFMKHKWHTELHHDPAYNRNLTLTYENFSLK